MRTRAWRRAQRERLIRKRLEIIRNKWFFRPEDNWTWGAKVGRFSKYNLTCDATMCRLEGEHQRLWLRHKEDVLHPVNDWYTCQDGPTDDPVSELLCDS